MAEIKRIFPGAVNGVINWMEENFHDIDEFVATFHMKDGTTMTVYDCFSYFNATAITGITHDTIQELAHNDEFVKKEKRGDAP